jgi:hypothetical protein
VNIPRLEVGDQYAALGSTGPSWFMRQGRRFGVVFGREVECLAGPFTASIA